MVVASVVIPVLNQNPQWLQECIASALAQTVPTETIVVYSDRTGPDNFEVFQRFEGAPGFRTLPGSLPGFAEAFNTGIRASRSSRVGFLLSDDWLEPRAVESCLPHSADIVSTGHHVWLGDGTRIRDLTSNPTQEEFEKRPTLESKARYLEHFFLFRKEAVEAAGGLDPTIGLTGCDDYDLIWTMLERGATVVTIPDALYNYRDHAELRLSLRPRDVQRRDVGKILDKHGVLGAARERILEEHSQWFGKLVHEVWFEDHLGSDLWHLAREQPGSLVSATRVSPLQTRALPQAAYQLVFSDGRTLKGRRCEDERQAATEFRIVNLLPSDSIAQAVAIRGTALLLEWVPGVLCSRADLGVETCRQMGELLGQLHQSTVVQQREIDSGNGCAEVLRKITDLVESGCLSEAQGTRAQELVQRRVPARHATGLCHGDLCPENLVRRPSGRLCAIDNQTVDEGPWDYDIGRTWYRSGMSGEQWDAFLSGYARFRSPAAFLEHFPYWAVRVLTDSAEFRRRARSSSASEPLDRLVALLRVRCRELGPETSFRELRR